MRPGRRAHSSVESAALRAAAAPSQLRRCRVPSERQGSGRTGEDGDESRTFLGRTSMLEASS